MSTQNGQFVGVGEFFTEQMHLTKDGIRQFATTIGDLNPIHHDEVAARAAGFDGIIASGPQPAALFMAMTATYFSRQTAMLGLEFQLKFLRPVLPHVTYQMRWTVIAVQYKEKLSGDIVQLEGQVIAPNGEVVLGGTATVLVKAKL